MNRCIAVSRGNGGHRCRREGFVRVTDGRLVCRNHLRHGYMPWDIGDEALQESLRRCPSPYHAPSCRGNTDHCVAEAA